jgi:hypothetical protein
MMEEFRWTNKDKDKIGDRYWILDAGYWILDTGYWILDAGYWILDAGYWILDAGYWILEIGNRGCWYEMLVYPVSSIEYPESPNTDY